MADPKDKVADNIEGRFFVDSQCIDCDLCRTIAPDNFRTDPDLGHSYVYKQPENEDEAELCTEAMENCPVEAIGDEEETS